MSTISAGTTSTTTLIHSGDTTGSLIFQTNNTGSGGTTAMTIDTSQNVLIGATSSLGAGAVRTQIGSASSATAGLLLKSTGSSAGLYSSTNSSLLHWKTGNPFAFLEAADDLSSTTERMRIDSSGNVGIGTSSPTDSGGYGRALDIVGGANGAALYIRGSTNTSTVYGSIQYDCNVNRTNIAAVGTGNFLRFVSASAEAARIDSSGNLLVGGTNAGGKITLTGKGSEGWGAKFVTDITSSTYYFINFCKNDGSASQVGSISSNGTTTSYNTSSDYRLKENIAPMTGALATVTQLKPVTYKWKSDGSDGQGFIAHELQEVVPDCVTGEKDAVDADGNPVYQGVDTSFLVATLTAAIQELKAINDQQAQTITALTARIVALENK